MTTQRDQSKVEVTSSIVVTIHGPDTLILRNDCGSAGHEGGPQYELSFTMQGNPIVRLPDGRWASFSWPALVDAAIQAGQR